MSLLTSEIDLLKLPLLPTTSPLLENTTGTDLNKVSLPRLLRPFTVDPPMSLLDEVLRLLEPPTTEDGVRPEPLLKHEVSEEADLLALPPVSVSGRTALMSLVSETSEWKPSSTERPVMDFTR